MRLLEAFGFGTGLHLILRVRYATYWLARNRLHFVSKAMTRWVASNLSRISLLLLLIAIPLSAEQNCPLPPAIQPQPHEVNIFSDQQEVYLGDAMAESLARKIKIIDDDKLNAYLRTIGDRLVQHLPPNQMTFRFYLVELPQVNAFSIAGGRVYVARKMIALTRNEDELAGVIAHELGHIVTHQTAIQVTAQLREVLSVRQVGDRGDVFEKFHQLLENEARITRHVGDQEDKQYVADQVALYAMARAGYAPHAYVDLWDRFQQTHGKTGNWFSNLFGTTKPSERRLGVMLKNFSALPPGCSDIPPTSSSAPFVSWQGEVIAYSGFGTKEALPGLVFKQTLARPLRPDVTNLRFSPDGKYLLAQDEGGIHVLTREPFAVMFYIPAIDARPAHFTPDSQSIVFDNHSLRVESWSVAEQQRTSAHELTVLHSCAQTELSPDGATLSCLTNQLELSLIDVFSGAVLASRQNFLQMNFASSCTLAISFARGGDPHLLTMRFSPDGRYFVASGHYSGATHFAWDLNTRHEVSLPGSIKQIIRESFVFLSSDRLVGIDPDSPKKSAVVRFPSGERLQQFWLPAGIDLSPATQGDYFFASPLKTQAMGLIDVAKEKVSMGFKHPAADVYNGILATEQVSGKLALHSLAGISDESPPLALVSLPQGRLAPLRAAAVSPDFNWMAISHGTRGGIWDVTNNVRTMELTSFHGAWFAPDHTLYVDLSKERDIERAIAWIDPISGGGRLGYKIGDAVARQIGPYLLVSKPRGSKTTITLDSSPLSYCLQIMVGRLLGSEIAKVSDEEMELRDVRDGHLVWSRYFPHELPDLSFSSGKVLLRWPLNYVAGREELGKYPDLKNAAADSDYLVEQVDLQSDAVIRKFVIRTNKRSFTVNHTLSEGNWVIATASGNQVFTYSMVSGQEQGHFFGSKPSTSQNGWMALENEAGQLSIYDMANSELKRQYTFADPISFKTFSPDGKRLFVVTASQTAYVLDLAVKN